MRQPKFWALGAWHPGEPRPLALQLARETMFSAEGIEVAARQLDGWADVPALLPSVLDYANAWAMSLDCAGQRAGEIIRDRGAGAFLAEVEQYSGISRALANTTSGAAYRLSDALRQLWHAICAALGGGGM